MLADMACALFRQAAGRAGPQPAPDDMIEKLPRLKISQDILGASLWLALLTRPNLF